MPAAQLIKSVPRWKPLRLPPGFTLAAHNLVENAGVSIFEHLVYSDGLASVSVYIEDESREASSSHGSHKLGTANAFSRHVGNKHVTVIGEVPSLTVQAIGASVEPPVAAN